MRFAIITTMLFASGVRSAEPDPTNVFKPGEKCPDSRLGKPKTFNGYFPFTPPASKESWNVRRQQVREQLLVANGLWPMPEKTPLEPVIHGKIERDGYTIEKVYFASLPGHYVSGNLYRPTGKVEGKRPAVLNPHGHWSPEGPKGGRFHDAGETNGAKEIKSGAEKTMESARFPLQAKCAGLARMGFIVFQYDMVGYADSQPFKHRTGFGDVEGELRGQSFMGLQTWNSIRALDFLTSLPDVDAQRIGVTGASGGGTQTFIIGAIDDRPAVAFPAVMVSTAMQGGCVCENCTFLRVGSGNIEIAGMFAPKPLAMSAARDWTIDIETKGLPELKQLYKLYGAEDKVAAKCWPEFGHNYNQVAREFMYHWFNKHLFGKDEAVAEKPFVPVPPADLSVYDEKHPRPKDEVDAARLRQFMTEASDKQIAALEPKDAKSLEEYRRVVGTALHVMMNDSLPSAIAIETRKDAGGLTELTGDLLVVRTALSRTGAEEAVPTVVLEPKKCDGRFVLWVHPDGKASLFDKNRKPVPAAQALLDKNITIVAIDAFQTGELKGDKPFPVDAKYPGFTFGYNRPVFANRVHDVLTAIAYAKKYTNCKTLDIVGWESAGPWVAAARALAGDSVRKTAVDLHQFRFENVKTHDGEMLLPMAQKYGGLPAFLALCAPHELLMHNHAGTSSGKLTEAAYELSGGKDKLTRSQAKMKDVEVVEWLVK